MRKTALRSFRLNEKQLKELEKIAIKSNLSVNRLVSMILNDFIIEGGTNGKRNTKVA